jgi:hypothetical protein
MNTESPITMAPVMATGTVASASVTGSPVTMVDVSMDATMSPVPYVPVTVTPVLPFEDVLPEITPTNCQNLWENTFADIGSMGNYPRPQGNLPMYSWGLTNNAQKQLGNYYKQAFSGYGN